MGSIRQELIPGAGNRLRQTVPDGGRGDWILLAAENKGGDPGHAPEVGCDILRPQGRQLLPFNGGMIGEVVAEERCEVLGHALPIDSGQHLGPSRVTLTLIPPADAARKRTESDGKAGRNGSGELRSPQGLGYRLLTGRFLMVLGGPPRNEGAFSALGRNLAG